MCLYSLYTSDITSDKITIRAKEQLYVDLPSKNSVTSLKDSYSEVEFDVKRRVNNDNFLAAGDISLVELAPVALFRE